MEDINTNSLGAIKAAISHYSSEVKAGKVYAIPILEGLLVADLELQKYHKVLDLAVVSLRDIEDRLFVGGIGIMKKPFIEEP